MILTNDMLMAAFRYRETKLWEKLDDSMVFAFQLSDGETGYCCVMGNAGEHLSLGFYRGAKGFSTYLKTVDSSNLPQRELLERSLTFECINCDFTNSADANELDKEAKVRIREFAKANGFKIRRPNGWPDFTQYTAYKRPFGIISESDAQDITEALNAATAVAGQLEANVRTATCEDKLYEMYGFDSKRRYPTSKGGKKVPFLIPDGAGTYKWSTTELPALVDEDFPKVTYDNMTVAQRLKKMKHEGSYQCRAIHLLTSVSESPDEIPFFPSVLLFVRARDSFVFPVMPQESLEKNPKAVLAELESTLLSMGSCPETIRVSDLKTQNLLTDFCKKTGIELVESHSQKELNQAWDYMLAMLTC